MKNPEIPNLTYWSYDIKSVLNTLETSRSGLSDDTVQERTSIFGLNKIPNEKGFPLVRSALRQFTSPLIIILIIGGAVTAWLNEWRDSIAIFAAVLLNAALGFYQEAKAEKALAALQQYAKEYAIVRRNGREYRIESQFLVPGDVVRISHGNKVPADGRILESNNCEIDESILTGESLAVVKKTGESDVDARVSDRFNMAYMGTTVVEGSALIVVTATGAATELGKIATAVRSVRENSTPLQKLLTKFTYQIGGLVLALAAVLFFFGIANGMSIYEMFVIAVAVSVSAVPEGLPIALTVILAIGVERMARKRGVVKSLLAAETLGSTTVVLTDKTGTLTEARMEVSQILPQSDMTTEAILQTLLLINDAVIENPNDPVESWSIVARPIESAIARAAGKQGFFRSETAAGYTIVEQIPFLSARKYSGTILEKDGRRFAVFFGAPEIIQSFTIQTGAYARIAQQVNTMAGNGERVLALATIQDIDQTTTLTDLLQSCELELSALLAFRDPIRASVPVSLERIQRSGVRVIIVTGDHPGTARTIAQELGWKVADSDVLSGFEIDQLKDEELSQQLRHVCVVARVTPEQKLRIAQLLRAQGEIVAMTGDGVNDAPALREADIGVAIGTGSDVAKASADLILLDNNFDIIVLAIEEGRKILQNIRKVIAHQMASVFDELVLIAGAIFLGIALPLSALQILWVNLVISALPGIALAFESHAADIGKKPVRLRKQLLDGQLRFLIFVVGTATSFLMFGMYYFLLRLGFDPVMVRTFIFTSFSVYTLFLIFSVRSLQTSILSYSIFSNWYLLGASILGFITTGFAIYWKPLQEVFGTVALGPVWIAGTFVFGIVSILLVEIAKYIYRRK